jgi:hypothetical protein
MAESPREPIAALDRRIPQVERMGEQRIAGDAERRRAEDVTRLAALTDVGLDTQSYDQALVEAILADDGGPPAEAGTCGR